jgi:hypothetical protein
LQITLPHADGDYRISDDPALLDLRAMHSYLRTAYWSQDIPFEVLERAVGNSLCLGAYHGAGAQVGLARFVSDYATFCYVCDVYVLAAHTAAGGWRARCSPWRWPIRAWRACAAGTS